MHDNCTHLSWLSDLSLCPIITLRDQERYVDKLLAGWFCFVQTVEGKVATVSYDITDNLQAVNFKKAIAAAFQANFKGIEEEEEIDPQSKHISHYRWGAKWSEDVHVVALFI